MSQFRLVILDNVKSQLESCEAQKVFTDMLFAKQKNFLRTDENYVVMDKHDMIGTHYMIYDTSDFQNPTPILAIRTTFTSRASAHKLETPLVTLLPHMDDKARGLYAAFKERHTEVVDCNAWFVDPQFSKKHSGLRLSDIAYLMVVMNILQEGAGNFIGCANEKYSASRWLAGMGDTPQDSFFEHPAVQCTHKLVLMENFNLAHFANIFAEHEELMKSLVEIRPSQEGRSSLYEFAKDTLAPYLAKPMPRAA